MIRRRLLFTFAAVGLLAVAFLRIPAVTGQSAVPLSRPGQEDLSFWVNHNGLQQLDVEGEVGFGDMARLLIRRRSNCDRIRPLRDRFTFRIRDMAALDTPDLFRAELSGGKLSWLNKPAELVIADGHIFNLPLVIVNRGGNSETMEATLGAGSIRGVVPPGSAAGYFLKVVESKPGPTKSRLTVRLGNNEIAAGIAFDVRPLAKLRVSLLDEEGRPSSARVYVTAADGLGYAPPGSISRIAALPAEQYFHAQRSFELELPAGETLIEAIRGPEYQLTSRSVDLKPSRITEVRLRLKRWVDMASQEWYSSDAHIHANYTANDHQVITPDDVRLQTLAEDLNNANMMVANSGSDFLHDEGLFEGKPHRLSQPNYVIYWNEEMRNSGIYGHMSFFNLKSLVHPIYTGFKGTRHWEDYPPNYAQAEAAQKQGGAVTYVHPGYAPNLDGASARELPVDLALGQVDAIDVVSNNPEEVAMELWYRLLNCGFRLAISAGTDSFTNVADHYTPGGGRVYVHLDGPMRYGDWIRNYKRGRSFASNGPVIFFTLNGKEPGDELHFPEGAEQKLHVKATVQTQVPLDKVEVVVNGATVTTQPAAGKESISIDEDVTVSHSSWVAVRALGPWHRLILNDTAAFAHTSPVYVRFGEGKIASSADARFYRDWIDRLISRVQQRGRFATPERRREVVELFRRAEEIYRQIEQASSAN
jgi:TolB protein